MPEIQFPPDMQSMLADFDRRLAALERSPRLPNSSIAGGTLQILDSNGNRVVNAGAISTGTGLEVFNSSGSMALRANGASGLCHPAVSHAWQIAGQATPLNSAVFTNVYNTRVELVASTCVRFTVTIVTDALTTGDVVFIAGGTQLGNVYSLPAGGQTNLDFSALHGITMGTGPILFNLRVRRTAGTGNLNVFPPTNMTFGAADGQGGGFPLYIGGWQAF